MARKRKAQLDLVDQLAKLDEHGREIGDPKPVAIPVGFKRPETLAEQVQRLVRTSISRQAEAEGKETFEESEDFDVGDDDDPRTPYETFFDPVLGRDLSAQEFREHESVYRERYLRAQAEYFAQQDRVEVVSRRPTPTPTTGTGAGGGPATGAPQGTAPVTGPNPAKP